jgi:hypothetical protein
MVRRLFDCQHRGGVSARAQAIEPDEIGAQVAQSIYHSLTGSGEDLSWPGKSTE